jgi:regulatory protein
MSQAAASITALRPLGSDATRVSIRVGRRTVAVLHSQQVQDLNLRVGAAWTAELRGAVEAASAAEAARLDAVKLLRRRALSAAELAERLRRKGHSTPRVEAAVARMIDKGLIDDERYARSVVEITLSRKPAGRRLLLRKLIARGIPDEVILRVLAAVPASSAQEAGRLAARKLAGASMRRLDPTRRNRRLYSLLGRRGFDADTIRQTLSGLEGLADLGQAEHETEY